MAIDLREKFFDELVNKLKVEGVQRLKMSTPTNGRTLKLNGIVLCKISKNSPYKNKGLVIWKHLTQDALDLVGGMRAKGKKDWAAAPLTDINYPTLMELLMDVAIKSKSFKTTMRPKRPRKRGPKHQASMDAVPTIASITNTATGKITYNADTQEEEPTLEEMIKDIITPKMRVKAKKRKRR